MRKIISLLLILSLPLVSLSTSYIYAQGTTPKVTTVLQQLEKDSGGSMQVKWNSTIRTPSLITGKLSLPSKHSAEWIAYGFLNKTRTLYGLENPKRDMKILEVVRQSGLIKVYFQHQLFGIPVWKDELIVEMDNKGVIQKVIGTIHPNLEQKLFNRPMYPAISKKQAIRRAKGLVSRELVNEPKVESYYLPTRPGTPLIYAVKLQYRIPAKTTLTFIHSLTGRIIEIQVL